MKVSVRPLIAMILLLGSASAFSQTLNWASLSGSEIVDSQGIPIDKNAFVFELGTFDPTFVPAEHNIAQWIANWRVFDTADYSYNPLDGAIFTGTENIQNHAADYSVNFKGLEAYIFVRNNTNTEFFLARPSSSAMWVFPDPEGNCPTCPNGTVTTWSLSELGGDTPIWGSQSGFTGGGTGVGGTYDLQTLMVPEVGSSFLGLLGCGLILFRRQRQIG